MKKKTFDQEVSFNFFTLRITHEAVITSHIIACPDEALAH
jgi:hypothetical protein